MEMLTAEFLRKLAYPTSSYNFLVYDNSEGNKFIFVKFLNHLWRHSRITEKKDDVYYWKCSEVVYSSSGEHLDFEADRVM